MYLWLVSSVDTFPTRIPNLGHIRYIAILSICFAMIFACAAGPERVVSSTGSTVQPDGQPALEDQTGLRSGQIDTKKVSSQKLETLPATPRPLRVDFEKSRNMETVEPDAETLPPATVQPPDKAVDTEKEAEETVAKEPEAVLEEALDFCQAAQDFWQKGELDSAIEALDEAYDLILTVETGDIPKLIQQKEDIRFMISKRILEIYASRHIVVNGNHDAIPITLNQHVQRQIHNFSRGREKDFFLRAYRRSGRYRPHIIKALRDAGLPEELSWLPLIESGFKANAFSKARALGLWQFISSTGYKFGLKRTEYVDERMDPVKSTRAAIAYLKELHNIFGDWTTVMAAYNCGENRVLRVIRKQNINYLDNFWDLYQRLPRETAHYVPRFLATLHMVRNPENFGLDPAKVDSPMKYETVVIPRQAHLREIARSTGISEKNLRELNPELRYQIVPGSQYSLRVPPGMAQSVVAVMDKIPVAATPRPTYVYHRIRPGETLGTIARRYRTSISSIASANGIPKQKYRKIVAGKKLKIPQKGIIYQPQPVPLPDSARVLFHTVRRGDSLWNLAKQYGTTTQKIQRLNGDMGTELRVGQRLRIADRSQQTFSKAGLKTYLVKRGDTPFKIAKEYRMPLGQLLQLNGLSPRSKIFPNQKLFIR